MAELAYRRALLKLSGEALAGKRDFGIDIGVVDALTDEIREVHQLGVSLGLVIGGGYIIRGTSASSTPPPGRRDRRLRSGTCPHLLSR